MMVEIRCNCTLSGEKFSPQSLTVSNKVRIIESHEPGDYIEYGRFKGSISKEGFLIIEGDIDYILSFVENVNKSQLKRYITYLNICMLVEYQDQCNFELSTDYIKRFSALEIPIGISCYEKDNHV